MTRRGFFAAVGSLFFVRQRKTTPLRPIASYAKVDSRIVRKIHMNSLYGKFGAYHGGRTEFWMAT